MQRPASSRQTSRVVSWTSAVAAIAALPLLTMACDGEPATGSETSDAVSCAGAKLDAGGRCRHTNGRFAKKVCCEPPAAEGCHGELLAAIDACADDWRADPDFDPSTTSEWDLIAACSDVEPMAGPRDAICEREDPAFCALDIEAFALDYLPTCQREATHRWLDRQCVFGAHYRDLFRVAEAIVVVGQVRLTVADARTAVREAQILSAVEATAHTPANIDEAFAVVDGGEVWVTELWDASKRAAFTAVEMGAGDNSFGKIFAHGTTDVVATISDGDLVGCTATWGPERRRCQADDDCLEGTRCHGRPDTVPFGSCIAPQRDDHPENGNWCAPGPGREYGCPDGSGLVCGGAGAGWEGMCVPGWQRGRFLSTPELPIPDGQAGGVESTLFVYGLATVALDVRISLHVAHPRPADLLITLENPASTVAVVFDGTADATASGEVFLDFAPQGGFPSDESVNGAWRLHLVDRVSGQAGTLREFGLQMTSHWD